MRLSPPPSTAVPGEMISHSAAETFEAGARLGQRLTGGEVILLAGPLGAGKTIFIKGLTSALGIDSDEVTSPSFTLVNRYEGRLTFYHLDLYRLDEGYVAAHAVGLDELLADESAVIAIEWAERLGRYPLPQSSVWSVLIAGDGEDARRISISRG